MPTTTLGFIGLGLMGHPMAGRLLKAGYAVHLWNRTKEKAASLTAAGAVWCESPREVAERTNAVHTMLADPAALRSVVLGENGVLAGLKPGGILVDHSTVSPELTRELEQTFSAEGKIFMHVPVLGGVPQAAEGSLLLFVGGEEEGFRRCEPALKILGARTWRFPSAEQATATKLLCNSFIAAMVVTLAQAFVVAERSSVDPAQLLEILGQSALNAPMYQTKGRAILEKNFAPRFFVEHLLKDVNLVLDLARAKGLEMPTVEAARTLYNRAMTAGLAKEDYSAVVKILAK